MKSWIVGLALTLPGLIAATDASAHCHHGRYRNYAPRRMWVAPAPRIIVAPPPIVFRHPRPHFYHPRPWRGHRKYCR